MIFMRFLSLIFFVFITSFLMVSCTDSVNIPKGKLGVLLEYGKVEGHAEGPSVLNPTKLVGSVVIFDKQGSFSLGGWDFIYEIKDPEIFYSKTGLHNGLMNMLNENYSQADQGVLDYVNDVIRERSIPITVKQKGRSES